MSIYTRKYFQTNASGAQKNMPKINQPIVLNTMIALPPLEEQNAILKKIENLYSICDELDTQINSSKTNSQTLIQAVLKEAFEK
ncbi:restriction endonuclease subunit S [Candidatus Sulfurimonas baltica]|uniref:Restriction endonuclease subunit S n=1 Tax=Candidatus Sulfurimonas baltica TaxID=2740404 RepID=A0A7S7LVP3_9BACT|nr:restriction endonuclease subunit S [Candidatus Sulfurimonas baltica]QOY52313.1 restriction endonuclease subunit S [Candidatus Sulfurimonas baltica]